MKASTWTAIVITVLVFGAAGTVPKIPWDRLPNLLAGVPAMIAAEINSPGTPRTLMLGFVAVAGLIAITALVLAPRRNERRRAVTRLSRRGRETATIARRTGLEQDGVRQIVRRDDE